MGPIGVTEMMGIFIIALLLFGPKKLPELGKMLAKGLTEFRRAKNELRSTFETHLNELEKETRLEQPSYTPPAISQSSPSDPYSYDEYGHSDMGDTSTVSSEPAVSQPASPAATPEPVVSSPVAGTVPRVNGIASHGSFPTTPNEEHPV